MVFQIILLGDSGTGKTALLRRHVEDVFEENHLPTIGVDFAVKSMAMPNEDMVKLQVIRNEKCTCVCVCVRVA